MSLYHMLEDFTFTSHHGNLINAMKGTVIRSSKNGRIMLVQTKIREGGQIMTRTKERPTDNQFIDVAKCIHAGK